MNKKIAIVTCSNAGLDYFDYPKDIEILRSVIHIGEKSYIDYTEIKADEFYEILMHDKKLVPKTSYMPIGEIIEIFEKLERKGYDEAIVITISSGLSGLNDAVKRVQDDVNIKLHVIDSLTLAYAEAYLVLEAKKMVDKGFTAQQIIEKVNQSIANQQIFFAVESLLYLVKNGRLSKFQGKMGSLLKIKPLLQITDGKVDQLDTIRTFPKALQKVLEAYIKDTKDKDVVTYIAHAHSEKAAAFFKGELEKVFPEREIHIAYLSPVVGAHTGPKAIGLGYIERIKY